MEGLTLQLLFYNHLLINSTNKDATPFTNHSYLKLGKYRRNSTVEDARSPPPKETPIVLQCNCQLQTMSRALFQCYGFQNSENAQRGVPNPMLVNTFLILSALNLKVRGSCSNIDSTYMKGPSLLQGSCLLQNVQARRKLSSSNSKLKALVFSSSTYIPQDQ